jgi:hypothetical protein
MHQTSVALSAVVLFSAAANAAIVPYKFAVLDAGVVPGTLALPITWTGPGDNRAFSAGAGSLTPPSADLIDAVPRVRWDDYIMADPIGASFGGDPNVTGDGHTARPASVGATGTGFEPGRFVGSMYTLSDDGNTGGISAGPDGRVYLLNITLAAGSSAPTTQGVYLAIFAEGGGPNIDATATSFPALRFGVQNATNIGRNIGTGQPKTSLRSYYLDYIATQVPASELPASFGAGVNYQIFLAQTDVPAPMTSLSLLGVGAWAARRRRM